MKPESDGDSDDTTGRSSRRRNSRGAVPRPVRMEGRTLSQDIPTTGRSGRPVPDGFLTDQRGRVLFGDIPAEKKAAAAFRIRLSPVIGLSPVGTPEVSWCVQCTSGMPGRSNTFWACRAACDSAVSERNRGGSRNAAAQTETMFPGSPVRIPGFSVILPMVPSYTQNLLLRSAGCGQRWRFWQEPGSSVFRLVSLWMYENTHESKCCRACFCHSSCRGSDGPAFGGGFRCAGRHSDGHRFSRPEREPASGSG